MLDLEVQPERSLGNEQWEFILGKSAAAQDQNVKTDAIHHISLSFMSLLVVPWPRLKPFSMLCVYYFLVFYVDNSEHEIRIIH